jgi:hypothetical protein
MAMPAFVMSTWTWFNTYMGSENTCLSWWKVMPKVSHTSDTHQATNIIVRITDR